MCGQEGFFGTSCFQVVLDIEEMQKLEAASEYKFVDAEAEIEKLGMLSSLDCVILY